MNSILIFGGILVYILILTVRFRISPFITLISAAFIYGILDGNDPVVLYLGIVSGAAKIFQVLAIMVFCGVCIAHMLRRSGYIDTIVDDISRFMKSPENTAGIGGWILSLPLMCCNTAFVLIAPVIEQTVGKKSASPYLYIAAIASIISFVLIYPSPAVVPVMVTLLPSLADPWALDLVLIPVAVIMLVLLLLYARKKTGGLESEVRIPLKKHSRVKAWAPVITPFLLAGLGLLIPAISFFSIISIALFCGLLVAMVSVGKEARDIGIHDGTKYAGLIMFDLCGAGAFGAVIAAGSFPQEIYWFVSGSIPALFLPFILAAALQAASGSRVVSAATTAEILAKASDFPDIQPAALVLMIAGGSCMVSFVSDPYFWLVKRFTGDETTGVINNYTLPLAGIGLIIGFSGVIIQILSGYL
ncbi:predicted D-glycerate permease [Methanospirillum hungatei JF-1]|uniref:Predicted D-glycerate permease n=1 Tax=Methanospirillum hungatei JF-1 (strain ATCC 27890 / DSM 864 / NBRC 100397 / JF-1) TaxID=323259 RepID=Q2FPH1_METHJ|nr:GntP family permease [Methanospirillum hungatei]ABD39945.1 predicted D-glycerate permease [Methanospirillum hungatei JF-1]